MQSPRGSFTFERDFMADTFPVNSNDLGQPATGAAAITPHDTNELAVMSRYVYVGTTGNLKVTMRDGTTVTFTSVPAGTVLPIRAKVIWATGSTASNIVALS